MAPTTIKTTNLSRTYKVKGNKKDKDRQQQPHSTLVALDNVNLEVYQGELFGLLGPNGAGKTTLIKILTTLLAPTGGTAYVAGYDVVKQADQVRRMINMVSGGETSGYGLLKVHENLWMFSQFYGLSWKDAYRLIDELLEVVELSHKRNATVSSLSTGERQRMNFCRGFITDPTVLFLDEPTLGLDVHAARIVRDFTRRWLKKHPERTILLTTHYMAEADEICDRIAIIDHGKVLACDTPANLKKLLQKQPVFEIGVSRSTDETVLEALRSLPGVLRATSTADPTTNLQKLNLILHEEAVISSVVSTLAEHRAGILTLQKHEPTLEDVFIKLVGRRLTDGEGEG
jgi:ABC-2 type transport system ATP-binding protein